MLRSRLSLAVLAFCFTAIAGCGSGGSSGTPSVTALILSNNVVGNTVSFGSQTVATASVATVITLTNAGNTPITLSSVVLGGANASDFGINSACSTTGTFPAGSSCTVSLVFMPSALGTRTATVTVTDSAPGSPQVVTLTGTGTVAGSPTITFSPGTLNFPSTNVGTPSATMSETITNYGTAALSISNVAITGAGSTSYAQTNTCTTTPLPPAVGSCTVSVTFTPTTTGTLSASISVTDNAAGTPQTVGVTGTGTSSTATYRTLFATPMSDNSITPLYNLINSAQSTIDMTMYEMQDATFLSDLVARCNAGVKVRVIFSQNIASSSATAYNKLNTTTNCAAENSNNAFTNTHQKTITVDGATTAILSLNLQSQYYSTTRDFGIITNDATDIAAIEATFTMDWAAGTPYMGMQGPSDFSTPPGLGDDLVWSPFSTTDMLAIINNATTSLYIECEEFSASNIVSAVAAAATRGVKVVFICENESSDYNSEFTTIKNAGASVYYYSSSTGFYIHAKAVVADLGLSTEAVYMGSINYSTASLTKNRELGVYITGNTAISNPIATSIAATIVSDETRTGVHQF